MPATLRRKSSDLETGDFRQLPTSPPNPILTNSDLRQMPLSYELQCKKKKAL